MLRRQKRARTAHRGGITHKHRTYTRHSCLTRPSQVWKSEKMVAAAKRAGECVWRLGLLKKGLGLCHGMGGNGYVFLRLYQVTGVRRYLYTLHLCGCVCMVVRTHLD